MGIALLAITRQMTGQSPRGSRPEGPAALPASAVPSALEQDGHGPLVLQWRTRREPRVAAPAPPAPPDEPWAGLQTLWLSSPRGGPNRPPHREGPARTRPRGE